jgi:hypothetical protein
MYFFLPLIDPPPPSPSRFPSLHYLYHPWHHSYGSITDQQHMLPPPPLTLGSMFLGIQFQFVVTICGERWLFFFNYTVELR